MSRNRNPKPGPAAWVAGPSHLSCSPGEGFTAESQRGGNLQVEVLLSPMNPRGISCRVSTLENPPLGESPEGILTLPPPAPPPSASAGPELAQS